MSFEILLKSIPILRRTAALNVRLRTWPARLVLCCLSFIVCLPMACSSPGREPTATASPEHFVGFALSQDGRYLAVGTNYGLYMYQAADFQRLWFVSAEYGAISIVFSPDGSKVATKLSSSEVSHSKPGVEQIHTVILWDARTGERLRSWEEDETWGLGWGSRLAFSPDGTRLVSGKPNLDIILVRDPETGEQTYTIGQIFEETLAGSAQPLWGVAWSPSGDRIAFGLSDGTVAVWNAITGERLKVMEGDGFWWVTSLAFSPDGALLATPLGPDAVVVWNVESGELLRTLRASGDVARTGADSVAFSPDGTMLASGWGESASEWGTAALILWDLETGEQVRALEGHTSAVLNVAFTPDGNTLISGSPNEIIAWDVETGERLRTLENQ